MKILIATLLALPTLVAAQDVCPVPADLDAGLRFLGPDGTEVHTRLPRGLISTVTDPDADGISYRALLVHGVHVVQLSDLDGGSVMFGSSWRFGYGVALEDLPTPVAGQTWETRVASVNGFRIDVETVRHVWGREVTYTLGGCDLTAIPVRVDYDGTDYDSYEEFAYFPDIGTALLVGYGDDQDSGRYIYTDFERL